MSFINRSGCWILGVLLWPMLSWGQHVEVPHLSNSGLFVPPGGDYGEALDFSETGYSELRLLDYFNDGLGFSPYTTFLSSPSRIRLAVYPSGVVSISHRMAEIHHLFAANYHGTDTEATLYPHSRPARRR